MGNPTVRQMVRSALEKAGYDGLCGFDCGCGLDDLMPCGFPDAVCEGGYKAKQDGEDIISSEKPVEAPAEPKEGK